MPVFSPDTVLAMRSAQRAGETVMNVYNRDFSVSEKDGGEPVTKADTDSDAVIREMLQSVGYPILSEESADDLARLSADKVWIVDPLDGTADFIRRTGEFSIMIALVRDGIPIAGIIYQPTEQRLYVAEKGIGAFAQQGDFKELRVNAVADLGAARAITSRHHFQESEQKLLERLGVTLFVPKGSAGLKVADIAAGGAELYFTVTNKIKQWDTAAAHCLIHEAGGSMTSMKGAPLVYNTKDVHHEDGIVASNGAIHQLVVDAYRTS